jgi:DNA-binding GntR family transcriptional regulator
MARKAAKGSARKATARVGTNDHKRPARRQRGTGAVYVYDSLKAQILDLVLQPGTLLDETLVSRQFGVSRSPVREALIRLSAEGLVQNLRNRTSIVAPFDVASLPAYFDAIQLLYRLSARLAAGNATPARIAELERIVGEHEDALHRNDMQSMIRHNSDFHAAVADMSGNPFIAGWMRGLLDQGQRILRLYARNLGDHLPDTVLKPHRDMVAAIASGDPDRAEEAGRADAQVMVEEFKRDLSNRPAALLLLNADRST